MSETQPLAYVGLFDQASNYLENARVWLQSQDGADAYELEWDRAQGCYVGSGIVPGDYHLVAQAAGHDCCERAVKVEATGLRTVLLLGATELQLPYAGSVKMPSLYRGRVKTPFQPRPDLVAIALDDVVPPESMQAIETNSAKLTSVFLDSEHQPPHHARVFRFPSGVSPAFRQGTINQLLAISGVHVLGPLVHFDAKESISCLTDELVVRFHPYVRREQIDDLVHRYKFKMLRKLVVAENLFVFSMAEPPSYEMLDVANEVARNGLVDYAEPNLISIGIHDAVGQPTQERLVGPGDFLFPMQWHLSLIRCPQAWELIRHRMSPDVAMGSPDITIAVVDWGIDVGHPEFDGKLSNGEGKLSRVFDFHNMKENNDGRTHGHGTACAGVATALPNNGGVCGVAGNCRLMAIRRPEGVMAKETAYSDMYLWIAGIDPKSPIEGFPSLLSRGADVISNSFGYAAGLPISGLMQDTFDLITERGRGGRGVLSFFSTGNNDPRVDFTLLRPWAAYSRTCAVSASTLAAGGIAETHAKQSNFGGAAVLDFCAPSATALGAEYDPPRTHAIVSAADQCSSDPDPNMQPSAPSECKSQTATSGDAPAGASFLEVVNWQQFSAKEFLLIGGPHNSGSEFNRVKRICPDRRLELETPLKNPHGPGTVVSTGPAYSLHRFSGTSCATAIAAGVGALLLSAQPELSWSVARDILRRTAVKIAAANADGTDIWRDNDGIVFGNGGYSGPYYSRAYGFGRIDALAAIEAALEKSS